MSLKVLIADDEPIARDILTAYVGKVPTLELVGACSNALEVFAMLNKQEVDLLLLDINMPEVTGMDLLRSLKDPPMVIFTTAYSEYAIESYELNAIDYLLKPIAFDRFVQAVQKAIDNSKERNGLQEQNSLEDSFFVKTEGKLVRVFLDELYYVEGMKDYVRLWLKDGSLVIHSTMKSMEDMLQKFQTFLRVHRSSLINLKHVSEVEGNMIRLGIYTTLIGNTYKDDVLKTLDKYRLS